MTVFKLEILTPEGRFFEGEVESINFVNGIGKIEILANHITYMSEVLPSVISIKQDGTVKNAVVTEGIVDFKKNTASIVVEAAEWSDEIDPVRAQKA